VKWIFLLRHGVKGALRWGSTHKMIQSPLISFLTHHWSHLALDFWKVLPLLIFTSLIESARFEWKHHFSYRPLALEMPGSGLKILTRVSLGNILAAQVRVNLLHPGHENSPQKSQFFNFFLLGKKNPFGSVKRNSLIRAGSAPYLLI